jgi:hypothetical protein
MLLQQLWDPEPEDHSNDAPDEDDGDVDDPDAARERDDHDDEGVVDRDQPDDIGDAEHDRSGWAVDAVDHDDHDDLEPDTHLDDKLDLDADHQDDVTDANGPVETIAIVDTLAIQTDAEPHDINDEHRHVAADRDLDDQTELDVPAGHDQVAEPTSDTAGVHPSEHPTQAA